jgi:hypothetical protein
MGVESSVANLRAETVDVALLGAEYTAALERFLAYAARLAEQSGGPEKLPVGLLAAERLSLQEFARMRAALLEALAPFEPPADAGILSESRDEVIRRSIAKRNDREQTGSTRKQRLDRRRRRARLRVVD